MKIDILGLFGVANTMVALEFNFESSEISVVRKKRPNFQLSPIGLKCGILGILGLLKTMVIMKFSCDRNFGRPKNSAEFSTFSDWLEICYIGYIGYPENDGGHEIFVRSKIRPSEKNGRIFNFL